MFQNNMSHWLSLTSMSPSWLLFRRVAGVSERNLHQRRRWSHLLRLLNPPAALLHVRKKKQVFLWHFSRWSCTNRQSTMVGIFLNNKAEIWPALSMEISKKKIESKPSHQIFRGKKTVGKVTTHNLHRNPTSWWAKNSNLLTRLVNQNPIWWDEFPHYKGSLYYQSKQCTIMREIPQIYHTFCILWSPKKWVI